MSISDNTLPPYDGIIQSIADYVFDYEVSSPLTWKRARLALLDSVACAIESVPACSSFIGPVIDGTVVPNGFPLPGTHYVLDPFKAAFDLGSLIRYLDHNDAAGGAEWGHPSDNIGAILPVADWLSRSGNDNITMKTVMEAVIKAYEIQGCLQKKNSFNEVGLDHVILVKVASTAVVSKLLGLSRDQTKAAISQAFADGQSLRVHRQAPNTSPRKGWAAGDACMRAVQFAFMTRSGQPGFPSVLSTPRWGFYDTLFRGRPFELSQPFAEEIVSATLTKIIVAEGHGIAAVEAAVILSKHLAGRLDDVSTIAIKTQKAAMTIIDKTGPLHNAADRDHCMQYMVAVALLKGDWLTVDDYDDNSPWTVDSRVNELRNKMTMEEDPELTKAYFDKDRTKRTAGSSIVVTMKDGTVMDEVLVKRMIGHPLRQDTFDHARQKFLTLTKSVIPNPAEVWDRSMEDQIADLKVRDWVDLFALQT